MRFKGKLISWHTDKAFGFIVQNSGGNQVFIHKSAFVNRNREPQVNDVITFSISKDKQGRYCAAKATFPGEKVAKKQAKKVSMFSIYLPTLFLTAITLAFLAGNLPIAFIYFYFALSVITFLAYAFDKAKAKRETQRTPESSLHLLALLGGWPGAALAQQLLRHKSKKQPFRNIFWLTVIINLAVLLWLLSTDMLG